MSIDEEKLEKYQKNLKELNNFIKQHENYNLKVIAYLQIVIAKVILIFYRF